MHGSDGIVYADAPCDPIEVVEVKPLRDHMMLLTFSTGETRLFDGTKLKGEVFAPLKDEAVFMEPKLVSGVVTWQNEQIDVAPEFMYAESYPYNTMDILTA